MRASHLRPLLLLLCSLALTLLPTVFAHFISPSVASISIHTVDSGEARVTLADRRSSTGAPLAECTFKYSTNEGGLLARKKVLTDSLAVASSSDAAQKLDAATIAASLSGACVTSTSDFWSYELCFSQHLKQFHGADVYMLGRGQPSASTNAGHSIVMQGGDVCAALSPPKPRAVQINFACKLNAKVCAHVHAGRNCKATCELSAPAQRSFYCSPLFVSEFLSSFLSLSSFPRVQSPQIMSISESSTCFYEVQVASSLFCADASYPVVTGEPAGRGGAGAGLGAGANQAGPLDLGSEDWFVEMVELESAATSSKDVSAAAAAPAEPIVMCTAYSLEYRATSAHKLRFDSFELQVRKLQGSSASNRQLVTQLPDQYRSFTARMPGRVPIDPSNLHTAYGSIAFDSSSTAATEQYEGTLSYVKVYA